MANETYAILRETQSDMDIEKASEVLAPILRRVRMEVKQHLCVSPGILVSGLTETAAKKAATQLDGHGMRVFILPHSKFVTPPSVVELRRGKVMGEGFAFKAGTQNIYAPWNQIILIDSARVQVQKTVKVNEIKMPKMTARGGRTSYGVTRKSRTQVGWREFLEVLCYKPWVRVRIHKDDFSFAQTGLPVHPTRESNFFALAVTFKTRCPNAVEGPGMAPLFDGKPETRRSEMSMKSFNNHFLWLVQLRFRKKDGATS